MVLYLRRSLKEAGFMGELIFWGGSIVETFIFNELNSKKLYKDLADRGFKVKIIDDGGIYMHEAPMYLRFIPFFNLLATFQCIMQYNEMIDETIFYFQSKGMISPLTKKERELYRLNPTIKTAMDIAKEDYLRRKYGNSIILQSELGNTKIVYFYNFETLEIDISSCEGHLATLKKEDLDELVGTILEVNLQDYYDYYGDEWGYYHAIMDGRELPVRIIVKESDYEMEDILENGGDKNRKLPRNKKGFLGNVFQLILHKKEK